MSSEKLVSSVEIQSLGKMNVADSSLVRTVESSSPGLWFQAFESSTSQKADTAKILGVFFRELCEGKETVMFSDIGCARGILGLAIAKELGAKRVQYLGIDTEESALLEAQKAFTIAGIGAKLVHNSCFTAEGRSELPDGADISVLSHVAYYTKDLDGFTQNYVEKLGKNGVAVFIHNPPDSDTNQLREKYGASIAFNTAMGIETFLGANYDMNATTLNSRLKFPDRMADFWEPLSQVSYDKKFTSHNPELVRAKHLLEFAVQQPLEALQEKGVLDAYLTEVKEKLASQDNSLIVKSRIQAAISTFHEEPFLEIFDRSFKEMETKIAEVEAVGAVKKQTQALGF